MPNILTAKFYNQLWMKSAERDKYPYEADDDGATVPAWIIHERAFLAECVNAERAKRGLSPIDPRRIKEGEYAGDPKYGERLAEHCAQLAVEE